MKVLLKHPGKPYEFAEIDNTLEAMQKTVGGHIEVVTLRNGMVLVCDEEGRMKNKALNAMVRATDSLQDIVGTFFVCKVAGDEFDGLDDKWNADELAGKFNRSRKWVFQSKWGISYKLNYDFLVGLDALGYQLKLVKKEEQQ